MKFIFDLDGTICFDGMTIASGIKEALFQAQRDGHEIVFASARSYRDCTAVLGEELLSQLVIGLNGGLAYANQRLIFNRLLDKGGYQAALSFCHQEDLPYFVDDTFDYSSHKMEEMPFAPHVDPLNLGKRLAVSDLYHPIKMVICLARHEDKLTALLEHLSVTDLLEIDYHEHEKCLYINPYQTNKATTAVELIGDDFIAFGNDKNDLSLFQKARYSIQVGDYAPLSAVADVIVAARGDAVAAKIREVSDRFK